MKKLLVHVGVLFSLLLAACSVRWNEPAQPTPSPMLQQLSSETTSKAASTTDLDDVDWRRTANGWERKSSWETEPKQRTIWTDIMSVHPIVWATGQVLLSVGALVCFESERNTVTSKTA